MKVQLRNVFLFLLLMGCLTGAVVFHAEVGQALMMAGNRCVTVILPSLYFFSVLAALFVHTGLLSWMARPLKGWGGELLAVLLFSQIGGYPVGAQLLHQMYRSGRITAQQERTMLCACIASGPAFLLGTVCRNTPLSMQLLLMVSVTLPNLLMGWVLAKRSGISCEAEKKSPFCNAVIFQKSVESGAAAMLKICGMILIFAALQAVGEGIFGGIFPEKWLPAFHSILEISCVTEWMQQGGSFPMAAAMLTFGGICVHLQIAAICEGNIPWMQFWKFRILAAVCTYGICRAGMELLDCGEVAAALPIGDYHPALSAGNAVSGICLLVMSVFLVGRAGKFSVKQSKKD